MNHLRSIKQNCLQKLNRLTHSDVTMGQKRIHEREKKRTPAKSPFSQLATNTLFARSSIFFWLFLSVRNSGYLLTFPAAALGLWSIKGFSLIHCVRSGLPSCCLLCSSLLFAVFDDSLLFAVFARYLFSCSLMMLFRALFTVQSFSSPAHKLWWGLEWQWFSRIGQPSKFLLLHI